MTELDIVRAVQSWFPGTVGRLFVWFAARWLIFFYAPLAAATGWRKHRSAFRHAAYEAAWSGLLAFTVAMIMERFTERLRPFAASPDVVALIHQPSTYSLPSAHAAIAFAIATALARAHPLLGIAAFLIAILVAFGRVAAGVHYPSDVLAGALLGVACAFAVRIARKEWSRRRPLAKIS